MCHPVEIYVSVKEQSLTLRKANQLIAQFVVSTAENGVGSQLGSQKTPLGWHCIRAKIGANLPINTVFKARRPTSEIYSDQLAKQYPERDWVLTRILWLSGLEVGFNRLGTVDSMQRYIYIHGTPDTEPMGIPRSHGCIRMRNQDILTIFDHVNVGAKVYISES